MTLAPPTHLYLRLAPTQLHFARLAVTPPLYFEAVPYAMRHTTSLSGNLREARTTVPLLEAPITHTTVLVSAPVTAVPLDDFQEEDCEPLYNACFATDRPHRIFYDVVPSAHVVLLFAVETAVCHSLEEAFGKVYFTSALTPLLRHFGVKALNASPQRVFVHRHDESVDIAIFEGKNLLALNTFNVQTATDVAYYVFNLLRKLDLPIATTPLYVSAPSTERVNLMTALQVHSPQIFPIKASSEFNRHPITLQKGLPYDLVTLLMSKVLG